jgi:SPP1 gp7 family putative phage head morphogenesis protein
MWPLALEDVAFEEAIAWFRAKVPMTRAEWDALSARAREKAFMVSGVAQLDVITDVWKAVDKALADGTTLKEFQKEVRTKLESAWAGSVKNPAWRMETISRTNVQLAYSAGRWRQLQDPAVKESHPFLRYDAILDDRVTAVCKGCNGTTLPAEHPFWKSHVPPLHFNCRSALAPLTAETAASLGITTEVPAAAAHDGFGAEPDVGQWEPHPVDYPAALWEVFKRKRSPLAEEAPPPIPEPRRADVILAEKIAGASGSNEGGVYLGTDDVKRYVKFYPDPAQARGEHLANRIYRDLGFETPESELFEHDGKLAYASIIVEGTTTLGKAGLTKERAKRVLEGFAADVLTGNWDAVGLTLDNVLLLDDGRPLRVDNGGTFLFRAKAGRKPTQLLSEITEWDRLRDATVNPAYASVLKAAGGVSDSAIKPGAVKGIKAILGLREAHGSWDAYVSATLPGFEGADRIAIVAMLDARTAKLQEKLRLLTKRTRRAKPETRKDDVVFDFTSEDGKKLRDWMSSKRYDLHSTYDPLFAKSGLHEEDVMKLRTAIGGWVSEMRLGSKHAELYAAFANLNDKAVAEKSEGALHLQRVQDTRRERWRLVMEAAGVSGPTPTHLQIHRGVSGLDWVKDVAKAWADEESEHVTLTSHELASWSLSADTGRQFARSRDQRNNALFSWRVPIDDAVYDQLADDASFITSYFGEHEVIAGPGHDKGQAIPKRNVAITYRGKKYGFTRRNALLAQLRKDGLLV